MVNNAGEAKMSKFYFKRVVGAYSMSSRKQPDFLELKVISFVSYATSPGFGPGYVNTSAEIVKHYSAKIVRNITPDEQEELRFFLFGVDKFEGRPEMVEDIKKVKAIAREYIRREQDAWKREGRIS
jgi:hypothetical protein